MDAGTLGKEIGKVCPVQRTAVGKSGDRATWSWEHKEGATQEQIDAGNNVLATIPVELEAPPTPTIEEEVLYDHEGRIEALEGGGGKKQTIDEFVTKLRASKRGKPNGG